MIEAQRSLSCDVPSTALTRREFTSSGDSTGGNAVATETGEGKAAAYYEIVFAHVRTKSVCNIHIRRK